MSTLLFATDKINIVAMGCDFFRNLLVKVFHIESLSPIFTWDHFIFRGFAKLKKTNQNKLE